MEYSLDKTALIPFTDTNGDTQIVPFKATFAPTFNEPKGTVTGDLSNTTFAGHGAFLVLDFTNYLGTRLVLSVGDPTPGWTTIPSSPTEVDYVSQKTPDSSTFNLLLVPEPSTMVLAGTAALAGLGFWVRRRTG